MHSPYTVLVLTIFYEEVYLLQFLHFEFDHFFSKFIADNILHKLRNLQYHKHRKRLAYKLSIMISFSILPHELRMITLNSVKPRSPFPHLHNFIFHSACFYAIIFHFQEHFFDGIIKRVFYLFIKGIGCNFEFLLLHPQHRKLVLHLFILLLHVFKEFVESFEERSMLFVQCFVTIIDLIFCLPNLLLKLIKSTQLIIKLN